MEDLKDMERRVKARHFAWMPTAARQLLDKLALLKANVEGSPVEMILAETEALEDEVSDLLLQLEPRRPGTHGLYVPLQRQFFTRGYRPAKFHVMPEDDDEWSEAFYQLKQPLAELARITIASPDEYVCRFETTAYWAQTGVPARAWERRSDEERQDQLHAWEAKEGLVDPAETVRKSDLLGALTAWQALVEDAVTHYHVPPEWAPACVATQLREVGADFDLYRYALLDMEKAVAAFAGLRHVRDLQGKHAQTWRAHAILLGAYHRRLAAHLQEVRGTTERLAGDLSEYPRGETLSWIQRANKVLNALDLEVQKRQNAFWDVVDPREICGFYPAQFDGRFGKQFRDWYAPLHRELHEIAGHFIAAIEPDRTRSNLPQGRSGDADQDTIREATDSIRPSKGPMAHGTWIGKYPKAKIARTMLKDDAAKWEQVQSYFDSERDVYQDSPRSWWFRVDLFEIPIYTERLLDMDKEEQAKKRG